MWVHIQGQPIGGQIYVAFCEKSVIIKYMCCRSIAV